MGLMAQILGPSGPTHGRPPYSLLLSPGDLVPMVPNIVKDASHGIGPNDMSSEIGDEVLCGDHLLDEIGSICDWMNPIMSLGTRCKDMIAFQLAMRQNAIKKEFELGIEASTRIKYKGYCRRGDYPCCINAMVETKGSQQSLYVLCTYKFLCMF
jgi:hypothetical protein